MKTCTWCDQTKEDTDFYGRKARCKACIRELARQRTHAMTDEQRAERSRRQVEYQRTAKGQAKQRRARLKYRYGITVEDFDRILAEQGGTCCFCPAAISPYDRRLSVDHDHVTGQVRGILCLICNNHMGFVDRVGLDKVLAYLARGALPVR